MNINKVRRTMLNEKIDERMRNQITADYLTDVINNGETKRRQTLDQVQKIIEELDKQIKFLKYE